jgi:hypothetical protein
VEIAPVTITSVVVSTPLLNQRSAVQLQKTDWEIVRASVLETQLTTDAAEASTTLRICKLL